MNHHDPTGSTPVYRAAVIGAGSGGLTLAIGLAGFGHDVALIEAGAVGGDCTNVGCIPSKSLLHAAASGDLDPLATVRDKRDRLREKEDAELLDNDHIHLVRGHARLTARRDPHELDVSHPDGSVSVIRAENVVICTGSRPVELAIDGLDPARVLTNESVFELEQVPGTLVLVGGGAISLELATAFADVGSTVHIVELEDRLISTEDRLVSTTIETALRRRGIEVHTATTIERFVGSTAHLANGTAIESVDQTLVAVGRRPRLDDLALDEAGVASTSRGIVADSFGRTNVEGVYAVGDVTGDTLTTHGANSIGRRAIRAIALPRLPKLGAARIQPSAVYSQPPIASVGLPIDELEAFPARGRRRYVVALPELDRSYTDDVDLGIAIVDVERFTGKILRAAIVGPSAAEIIGIFTLAIDHGIGLRKIFGMVHPYPTHAELVGRVADGFAGDTFSSLPAEWSAMARARLRRVVRPNRVP